MHIRVDRNIYYIAGRAYYMNVYCVMYGIKWIWIIYIMYVLDDVLITYYYKRLRTWCLFWNNKKKKKIPRYIPI